MPDQVTDRPKFFEYLSPADKPVIDGLQHAEVVFAEHQPEYIPLRTLTGNTLERPVLSRWTLTPEQRKAVAEGADILLQLLTFGNPLQPILMMVADQPNATYFKHTFNLPDAPAPVAVAQADGCGSITDRDLGDEHQEATA